MRDNIILVDCDGVLCDWMYSFNAFMEMQGFKQKNLSYNVNEFYGIDQKVAKAKVKEFNDSAAIAFLPPLRDAVYYMKRLHMLHGYRFHVITSLSSNKYAQRLRRQNLELLFGKELFDEIICLPCGADKDDVLEKYKNSSCFWIEDKVENALVGDKLGLHSILVEHDYNANYYESDPYAYDEESENIPRFAKWKYIYNYITGEGDSDNNNDYI